MSHSCQSDVAVSILARENCTDEATVRNLVLNPDLYIMNTGDFWIHKDNNKNSPSRMIDKSIWEAIKQYERHDHDIDVGITAENGEKYNPSIDSLIAYHLNNAFILNMDIQKYFNSITYDMVEKHLPPLLRTVIRNVYFRDNGVALKQGLRGSAPIAEITGKYVLDTAIKKLLYEGWGGGVAYSRYCDDMMFSHNDKEILRNVEKEVRDALAKLGFTVNSNKTKLKPLNSNTILGRRIHNKKIIISKHRRNNARLKYYNALKAYEQCIYDDESSVKQALSVIESALGTANYIRHYHAVDEDVLTNLNNARNTLNGILSEISDNSPLLQEK